jgi:hypothetical protein
MPQDKVHANYDIGVEFSELTDPGRLLLIRFIDCVKDNENTVKGPGK